ncbi:PREDICTED: deleted in malignant brain tumors 1 protein [Amphimedon queenslandica]|uniref:SRCR domain-containing protein n=1 Tax=Amphimedon queenslandica TaxID=400682 RepID=A0AAN0J874_AMPQE|nr:PREDICTED: deleted in malignant brain tumors 1 protein [Amphimedon queenslandica]|eukprot:XP_019853225.1 PREDICTED: deleted in malignant brain tumors 1 protein [Amphimedon queenslandica]
MLQFVFLILLFSTCVQFTESCTNGSVRLANPSLSYGAVEVCSNGSWGSICSDFWDNNDASVVCQQLGYSPYGAIGSVVSYFNSSAQSHSIIDLNCTGNEATILSCPHNGLAGYACSINRDANVFCQNIGTLKADCTEGEVRLVNGNTQYEGRVEICINRVWGTVCSRSHSILYSWDTLDSNVVCRQAGHMELGSVAYTTASEFGQGSGPILISSIQCSGQESHLINCSYSPLIPSYCSHTYDVGVKCEAPCANGTVRLYSDSGSYFRRHGRVQVCVNNVWGTICDHFWDEKDASVVCRMLGYSPYGASAIKNAYTEGTWYIHINDLNCTGTESSLWDCPMNGLSEYSCNHYDDAAVACQFTDVKYSTCTTGEVRLVDGMTKYEGRVEVCENGVWGSVCATHSSNDRNTYTLCHELGYQGGIVLPSSNFGVSNNPILIYQLSCGALQSNLSNCYQRKYPYYYVSTWWYIRCNNYHELSIRCENTCVENKIELYGGPSSRHGSIRVCVNGSWVMVCGYGNTVIDNNLASVVCSSIGYSAYGAKSARNVWNNYNYPYQFYNVQCYGNESSLLDCQYKTTGSCPNVYNATVAVFCLLHDDYTPANCTDGDIRLYGGSIPNQGILHVCSNGIWGTVCSNNNWNNIETDIACFQLGYYSYGHSSIRGTTNRLFPIIYSSFNCQGNETTLLSCSSGLHSSIQYCTDNAIELNCEANCTSGDIRLVGGGYNYGRVEVCVEGVWGTVCRDSYWDNNDASIVCRQLGFSPFGSIAVTSSWNNEEHGITFLTGLNCNGTEQSIFDCLVDANAPVCSSNWADANVVCPAHGVSTYSNCTDGDIRLVGGSTEYEGRVEVCLNNAWGTVYSSSREYFAQTVCNALGFTSPGAVYYKQFGEGSGPILMYTSCYPVRNSLFDCTLRPQSIPHTSHENDAGVRCEIPCKNGDIRLVGGSDPLIGRVELCVNKTWGTICDDYWDDNDASVVCRQVGFSGQGAKARYSSYTERLKSFHIIDLNCNGSEENVFNCSHNLVQQHTCTDYEDASVQCTASNTTSNCTTGHVRLTGGQSQYVGLVEICYGGVWKSICPRGWDNREAQVVCRQLGFTSIGADSINIGKGFSPVHSSYFTCAGSEATLLNCSYYTHSCSNSYHAGVDCESPCIEGAVRLEGDDRYKEFGRVEVCINGTWGTICHNGWDNNDASVVCRQLGYSPYGAIAKASYFTETWLSFYLYSVNCNGNESTLLNCSYSTTGTCYNTQDAGAICQSVSIAHDNCTDYAIRLVNGATAREGIVQICLNRAWGAFCYKENYYSYGVDANLICRGLGYNGNGMTYLAESPSVDVLLIAGMICSQSATSIKQCSLTHYTKLSVCDARHTAAVRCHNCTEGSVRLIPYNSYSEDVGRVEVCVDGTWGSICYHHFTDNDAQVVCRHLGYTALGSISIGKLYYYMHINIPLHIVNLNCTGNEESIWDCPSSTQGQESCTVYTDVSVACHGFAVKYSDCANGQIRLSNGTSKMEGRVELCYNHVWFGICAGNYNNYYNIETVCNSMGYSKSATGPGYSSSFLDLPNVPLFPFQIYCSSIMGSLLNCSNGANSCYSSYSSNYYKYLGVTCEGKCLHGDIKLTSSIYSSVGKINVCVNGVWGSICTTSFDDADASVVCAQLGFSRFGSVSILGSSAYNEPVHFNDLNCTGNELSIWECPFNNATQKCYNKAAYVICRTNNATVDTSCTTGDVRLVGGINEYEGRVEICYNQMWGTICDYYWGTTEANVVCKQLGYQMTGSVSLRGSYYGEGQTPFFVRNLRCSSSHSSLIACVYNFNDIASYCGTTDAASVVCLESCNDGDVRLSGSSMTYAGRVELCVERSWTTLCDQTWDFNDAAVTCRQLGYSSYGAIPTYNCYTEGQLLFGITNLGCNGSEKHIFNCTHSSPYLYNCKSHNDAGLICQGSVQQSNCTNGEVRLVDGSGPYEGRVEVCINKAWGTVCSNGWTNTDANVVCKQLGYLPMGGRARFGSDHFGPGVGPILMASVDCTGNEESLIECRTRSCDATTCSHYNDAGVTLCDNQWDSSDSNVVCYQLGLQPFGSQSFTNNYFSVSDNPSFVIGALSCSGSEESLLDCSRHTTSGASINCQSHEVAGVRCIASQTPYSSCANDDIGLVGGTNPVMHGS